MLLLAWLDILRYSTIIWVALRFERVMSVSRLSIASVFYPIWIYFTAKWSSRFFFFSFFIYLYFFFFLAWRFEQSQMEACGYSRSIFTICQYSYEWRHTFPECCIKWVVHFPIFLQRTDAIKLVLPVFAFLCAVRHKWLLFITADSERKLEVWVLFRKWFLKLSVTFLVLPINNSHLWMWWGKMHKKYFHSGNVFFPQ